MMKQLRNYFITGLVILVPVVVTGYIVWVGFNIMDGWLRNYVTINGREIPGLGMIVLISLILFVGFLAHNYVGKKVIALSEDVITRIPLVNKIYNAARQISHTILTREKKFFQEVVAIPYPSQGLWTIGFVTSNYGGELDKVAGEKTIIVFICTAPNPTTGFVVAIPRKDAVPLNMSIEEAIRFILSAGVSVPGQPILANAELLTPFIKSNTSIKP